MLQNHRPSSVETEAAVTGLSSAALERRRMLLKSLGKGSAVVTAAALPMHTLAQGTALLTPTGKGGAAAGLRCSVSGMQSGVHSRETGAASTCGGYSPGWWGQADTVDGKRVPRRSWPYTAWNEKYDLKFGRTTLGFIDGKKPSLFQVMENSDYASSDTRHWIGAWLNGLQGAHNFPYTGAEIKAFYDLPFSDIRRQKAYELITTYLEIHG